MPVQSVSNLTQMKALLKDVMSTKTSIAANQQKITSGMAVQSYLDLVGTGSVSAEINLEDKVTAISTYISSNNVVNSRLEATDIALGSIIDELGRFRNAVVERRSAAGRVETIKAVIEQIGKASLGNIKDQLNVQYEGEFLFAGGRVDAAPVSDIVNHTNILNNEVTSNYYQGDGIFRTAGISDSLTITYSVRADDAGFQNAIGAINKVLSAESEDDIAVSLDLLNSAISEVITLRSNIGNAMSQVDAANNVHETTLQYFEVSLSNLVSTQIDEVMIQVSNDTAILYGSYQVYSMVSRLNLAEFLK